MTVGEATDRLIEMIKSDEKLCDKRFAIRYWSGTSVDPAHIQVNVYFDAGRPALESASYAIMEDFLERASVPEVGLKRCVEYLRGAVERGDG